jgi:hypothetical protein
VEVELQVVAVSLVVTMVRRLKNDFLIPARVCGRSLRLRGGLIGIPSVLELGTVFSMVYTRQLISPGDY